MATTMEQRAKFRELRTSGVDRDKAMAQAYGNITTPVTPAVAQIRNQSTFPVNPVTATPSPIPATVQGVDGQKFAQSEIDPSTGLTKIQPQTPVAQPAPITQTVQSEQDINKQYGGFIQDNGINSIQPLNAKTEMTDEPARQIASTVTSKTEAQIDYNQAQGREQDIIKNLDTFKAQNMTPEQIMRASDYQNATPEKKALIDPYLKQQVPTASAMYNAIATKADIPDEQKTSLPFKIAQNRYTKASSFSTMTASQLANEMDNSRFIQGSQAYEDVKQMNPKLVQDTENLRIVNGKKQNIFTTINNPDGTSTKVNNLEKTFAEDYMDNFAETIKQMFSVQTPEQIRAIIYTDDVKQAQDKASEIELSMNELEKQMDNVDADVDAEMKGSGATGSRIALEKSSRKDKLGKEYNSQLKNYTTYANKANNLITQNTTVYTTQQQQKQAQNAAMLPFLQDQYKTEQEKIKAEAALNDPATAIKSVMDEYKKLGIPFTSTVQSRLAEFKASGKPLEQFLTDMGKNIQASPAYKQYSAKKAGEGISYQTIGDKVYKNTNGVLTETGISAKSAPTPVWQEWEDASGKHAGWVTPGVTPSTSTATAVKPTGNIVPVTAGNKTVRLDQSGAGGFETAINQLTTAGIPIVVGQGARDQTATIKEMADRYGIAFNASNPAETAQKLRSAGHQVADPGKSNHESGMAIDVYGSSKLDAVTPEQEKILNANGWYSANIPGDAGHFEYKGVGGTGTQGTQGTYTDQNINDLAYLTELQEKNPTQAAKDMKELGYTARDLANYKAGNVPLTEKQKTTSTDIMSAIKDLTDSDKYEWNDAVGKFDPTRIIGTQDAEDATIAINNLIAKLTLPNLGVLKGPMSDKDIQFIKEASSKLATTQSNDSFERNLIDAYNLAARRAGQKEITKLSDLKSTKTNTVGGELNYSKYE